MRLDRGDVPGLIVHGLQELSVQRVDVKRVALVGSGVDLLELDLGLGEPRPEVSKQVAHGPRRVTVVAGLEAFLGAERANQPDELIPARPLRLDRIDCQDLARRAPGGHAFASTKSPSSGSPASSQSSNPPE
jgi:hypothetical protein